MSEPGRRSCRGRRSALRDELRSGAPLLRPDYLAGFEGPDDEGVTRFVDFEVHWRVACQDLPEPAARERFDHCRAQAVTPQWRQASASAWSRPSSPAITSRWHPARRMSCAHASAVDVLPARLRGVARGHHLEGSAELSAPKDTATRALPALAPRAVRACSTRCSILVRTASDAVAPRTPASGYSYGA